MLRLACVATIEELCGLALQLLSFPRRISQLSRSDTWTGGL